MELQIPKTEAMPGKPAFNTSGARYALVCATFVLLAVGTSVGVTLALQSESAGSSATATVVPTRTPTSSPTFPVTDNPSHSPSTSEPSRSPTTTQPSQSPSTPAPSLSPTRSPTTLSPTLAPSSAPTSNATAIFSTYHEGFSNNKFVDIKNVGASSLDLVGIEVNIQRNGGAGSTSNIALTGSVLAPDSSYRLCSSLADSPLLAVCDQLSGSVNFNGDDVLILNIAGVPVDVFGQLGFDPGAGWDICTGGSTANIMLIRTLSTRRGNTVGLTAIWDGRDAGGVCEWTAQPILF